MVHFQLSFSIHALREEGDGVCPERQCVNAISIHALREEGDSLMMSIAITINTFLSTPSARRATFLSVILLYYIFNFYPRPPRGGRQDRTQNQSNQP